MQPARTERSARAHQVVAAARKVIEAEGRDALTMRRLGDELGIRAPSLYKHFPDKAAVELAVIEDVLAEVGAALQATLADPLDRSGPAQAAQSQPSEAMALCRLPTAEVALGRYSGGLVRVCPTVETAPPDIDGALGDDAVRAAEGEGFAESSMLRPVQAA